MKKRTRVLLKRLLVRLSVIIFIIGILYIYLKTGFFTIQNYEIVGVPDTYKQILQDRFTELDKQKILKVFPGNRIISYHGKDIKSTINEVLPNTSSISIYPKGLHTLKISITSYTPLFKIEGNKAITKNGLIYTEITDINTLPTLTFASSSNITPEILSVISNIIPKISDTIFPVESINVDEYSDIYIRGNNNYSAVILSKSSDIKKIWSNIVSAIDTEPLKSKLLNNKNELEYLDTRFGNKVFFKFTGDSTNSFTNPLHPTIIPSHEATSTDSANISR